MSDAAVLMVALLASVTTAFVGVRETREPVGLALLVVWSMVLAFAVAADARLTP